ncbi:MAG: hypothetical protein HRU41_37125 [Saprospiraceae bacterium]|nr:hypothetical protein [Saprospiraceae bacterium]
MKSPVRERTYLLIGHLDAKYHGSKIENANNHRLTDYQINVYEAALHQAKVIDKSSLFCDTNLQDFQEVQLSCEVIIYPQNSTEIYQPYQEANLKIYQPRVSNVSGQGGEVNGTLTGFCTLPVKSKSFSFNPISIPLQKINGAFPGYQDAPPSPKSTQKNKTILDFWETVELLLLLLVIVLVFIFTYTFFHAVHPLITLILLGIIGFIWISRLVAK